MQCTAKSKRSGVQCQNGAIKGKDKCRMHGGRTPIKSGLYSKYAAHGLAKKIDEARNDPRLTEIREVLSVQSAALNNFLEGRKNFTTEDIQTLVSISDKISQSIERLNKVENGETYNVRIETVQQTVVQIVEIIKHYIPDARTREKFADDLNNKVRIGKA